MLRRTTKGWILPFSCPVSAKESLRRISSQRLARSEAGVRIVKMGTMFPLLHPNTLATLVSELECREDLPCIRHDESPDLVGLFVI